MNGKQTHIDITAYHEAGHALAALKVGRYVPAVMVEQSNPGQGVTRLWHPPPNPFDLARNPDFAWRHTYQTILDSMFISLAGPVAEAKLLHKPMRHLGSYSDYENSMELCLRLRLLAEYVLDYTDTPTIKVGELLDQQRDRTKRWVSHPNNWRNIESIARALIARGQLTGDELAGAIGTAGHLPRDETKKFAASSDSGNSGNQQVNAGSDTKALSGDVIKLVTTINGFPFVYSIVKQRAKNSGIAKRASARQV